AGSPYYPHSLENDHCPLPAPQCPLSAPRKLRNQARRIRRSPGPRSDRATRPGMLSFENSARLGTDPESLADEVRGRFPDDHMSHSRHVKVVPPEEVVRVATDAEVGVRHVRQVE